MIFDDALSCSQVLKATASMLTQTPEMLYNTACALIEKGDMEGALAALDDAERLFVEQVIICLSMQLPSSHVARRCTRRASRLRALPCDDGVGQSWLSPISQPFVACGA